GFDQIWLTPVHPSPTYHKYDVMDYYEIDPVFGTLEAYQAFLQDCHDRGISVLMDMVLNHTSVYHPWFQAVSDYLHELPSDWEPDVSYCKYFEYFNFSRDRLDGYEPLEGTNWYYEARFWSGMPDLNLNSETVRKEIEDIVRFWLDNGVDGFRLDAVTSYHTGDPIGNVEFTKFFCETCRKIKPDCYIVGEAWTDRNNIATLYSSGIDSLFNFPFSGNEGIIRNAVGGFISASDFVRTMEASDRAFSEQNPYFIDAPFYTNHDMARSAGYYALDEGPQTKMAYALNLLMSGNTFLYYGEELGMKGSGKDENKRAPMYWSDDPSDPNMCDGPPDMDSVSMKFPSLAEQEQDDLSLLNWFKQVIRVRNAFPAIARGKVQIEETLSTDTVAAFYKMSDTEQDVLILINLSSDYQTCDLTGLSKTDLSAVLNTSENMILLEGGHLTLPGYSVAIFTAE
ncbi:MAG: alpha-amylase, partial [Oscillospiraceae bacterium]|nr:alpha-amylase [Oscillospiraceae bacterium]